MIRQLTLIFDGEVFRPENPIDLPANTRYLVTIEEPSESRNRGNAWDLLEEMIGSIEAPPDWASQHDHYLYGTPKRSGNE